MKNLQQWSAVQELRRRGKNVSEIARELGMSRTTVRKLLKQKEAPKFHRTLYFSKIDPFKEQINVWCCKPYEFNGTRIYRELKLLGYQGSISPVYRYLNKIKEGTDGISSKATVRIETPVGDQAQFDWSEYKVPVGGILRVVYCFSMILSASRKKAIIFSLKADADAIYEAIQDLLDSLGGVPLEILIDNPKALVIENKPRGEDEIRYNPYALLLAAHLGTEFNACPCFWPRKKGKIERPFNYIEEQFIKGQEFASMEDLNSRARLFQEEMNNNKHTTTGRIPNEFFETEEKEALLPLPKTRYMKTQPLKRIVSADSLVSIDGNKYSLPVRYACKTVFFRIVYGFRIEIYDKNECLIMTHQVTDLRHAIIRLDSHYDDISPRTSTSIPQIRRDFASTFTHGEEYLQAAGKIFDQPTHHARKILELCDLYQPDVLDRFIAYAIEHGAMDIKSFKRLLKENFREIAYPEKEEAEQPAEDGWCDFQLDPSSLLRNCSYYENIGKEPEDGRRST